MIFLFGIITGLILSLPFGPVGIYCMEKAVIKGEKKAFVSATGMVTVDIIYGIISYLFFSKVGKYIYEYQFPLTVLVGIFLTYVGAKKFFCRPELKELETTNFTLLQDYFETFLLAIFNIGSIPVIGTIFTFLKVTKYPIYDINILELATGIGLGGTALWSFTIYLIHHFKKRVTVEVLIKISKYSGILILILAIASMCTVAYKHFFI